MMNHNTQQKSTHKALSLLLSVGAIVAGVLITYMLVGTKPKAKMRAPEKTALAVEVDQAKTSTNAIIIDVIGQAKATQSIDLNTEVSGSIISVSDKMRNGGFFKQGETILNIDDLAYVTTLKTATANYTATKTELEIEEGNQQIAKKEFQLLGEKVDSTNRRLILREPQMNQLKSNLSMQAALVEQAKNDLANTTLKAPFNGMIDQINTNIGSFINSNTSIASFIGTDAFWVELLVPAKEIKWIRFKDETGQGSIVRLYHPNVWGHDIFREAEIINFAPSLETNGQLVKVFALIEDPLSLKNKELPKIFVNTYLEAKIIGESIHAIAIPREHLRNGNDIWLMDSNQKLVIKTLNPVFKNKQHALIQNELKDGEFYITSGIAAPIEGMALKLLNENKASTTEH